MAIAQLIYSVPPLLTTALLAGVGWTALRRGRHAPAGRLLAMLCLSGALLYVDMLVNFNAPQPGVAATVTRLAHLFHPFLLPLWIQFFHAYLKIHRTWLTRIGYAYAVLVSAATAGGWVITGVRRFEFGYFAQAGPVFILLAAGATFATVYNVIILYRAIQREPRSIQKNKLKYIFFGFGLLGALTSLNCLTVLGVPLYPPGAFGFVPLLVFAAGVFKFDLLDMGLLLRKSLLVAVSTTMLIVMYGLLLVPVQNLFTIYGLTESALFPLSLVVLIALGFNPLKEKSQLALERLLARDRYDFRRTLRHASQTIAMAMAKDRIADLLKDVIITAVRAKSCVLFQIDPANGCYHAAAVAGKAVVPHGTTLSPDSRVVRFLLESDRPLMKQKIMGEPHDAAILNELEGMAGEIVLPMRFKQELKGFLVLGEKCTGALYETEDLDLLEPLCHQSAVAIQNAHAYQALQALNRTLEKKVADRTRDLEVALLEKQRSQEQLIRSESLAALGQLVAGVAHELNNPLTSVTSLLQSALEELQALDAHHPVDVEGLIDDLGFAGKDLARAKAIVASLLGLARQTQSYEEDVDMNAAVRDTLRILHNQTKYLSLDIVERLDDDIPCVRGNFANLGQVLLNILQNAVQAVDANSGRIVVSSCYDARARQVVLRCRDNGPGIDAALRQDVFKPFFTTKPVGQGTGLGLYICHQIIEKHRGRIELGSADPHGAEVTVRLPARDALF